MSAKSKETSPPRLTLTIGDTTYAVTILDPDRSIADAAVRLTKSVAENYDVRIKNGAVECECKGFLRANHCKHCEALVAVGLFPAPRA